MIWNSILHVGNRKDTKHITRHDALIKESRETQTQSNNGLKGLKLLWQSKNLQLAIKLTMIIANQFVH